VRWLRFGSFYALCAIVPTLIFNTLLCPPRKVDHTKPPTTYSEFDVYGDVLAESLKIPTVSYDETSDLTTDYAQLFKLKKLLEKSFPKVHSTLSVTEVNTHSLVYKWKGSNSSLSPIMLCAHLDVVPAVGDWQQPPFEGKIVDGIIWGRGAIDNKHNLIGELAAVEELLKRGFKPRRTVYLAMGHDEEIGGKQGAKFIAEHMKSVEKIGKNGLAAIFDEGTMMVEGALPGVKGPVALVSNSEKGAVTVELRVDGPGGHSSMPPIKEQNKISVIADAVNNLENNQFPAHFSASSAGVYQQLVLLRPYFSLPMKVISSNLWLFAPLMKKVLLGLSGGAAAMLRTTTATTVIKGGTKTNVLANCVKAYVNHRIHPNESIESVIERDKKTINDSRVTVTAFDMEIPPSPVSSITNRQFGWIEKCVSEVFHNPTTCSIMIGNTDTRWYWDLSDSIYRFSPVELNIKDLGMFHGIDERLSVDGMSRIVQYYLELIKCADEDDAV